MPYVIRCFVNGKAAGIYNCKGMTRAEATKRMRDKATNAVNNNDCRRVNASTVIDPDGYKISMRVEQSAWFVIRDIIRAQLAEHGGLCGDHPDGLCRKCGEEAYNVEPDARRYACESCGAREVYGFEELVMVYDARGQL